MTVLRTGRRKRTSKACDYCRSKKIKCDGHLQCAVCVKHHLKCTYNYVAKKRSAPKRKKLNHVHNESAAVSGSTSINSPNSSINSLGGKWENNMAPQMNTSIGDGVPAISSSADKKIENRLDQLESMINLLVSKVAPETQQDIDPQSPIHQDSNRFAVSRRVSSQPNLPSILLASQMQAFSPSPVSQAYQKYDQIPYSNASPNGAPRPAFNSFGSGARIAPSVSMPPIVNSVSQFTPPVARPTLTQPVSSASPLSANSDPSRSPALSMTMNAAANSNSPQVKPADYCERFFGYHTSISLFSCRGLKWIDSKVKNKNVTTPLRDFLALFVRLEHRHLSVWVDPIEKSQLVPFPSREVLQNLLEELRTPNVLSRLIDFSFLVRLLNMYCDHRDGLTPEPRYTYSELLLMNCSLLVACACLEEKRHVYGSYDQGLTWEDLEKMKSDFLNNSMFYYHRVSVVFDGLTGIRGILLLSMYADLISLSQGAYLIASTAIRQAQDIGLQQRSTYVGISEKEKRKRGFIWWMCYDADRSMCLRFGKPPIINDNDVSAPPPDDLDSSWMSSHLFGNDDSKIKEKLQNLLSEKRLSEVNFIAFHLYSVLTSRMYNQLFTANAFTNKSPRQIYENAKLLLKDLEEWRQLIPDPLRPTVKLNTRFTDYIEKEKKEKTGLSIYYIYVFVSLYYRYYYMKVMINKAIVKIKFTHLMREIPGTIAEKIIEAEKAVVEASMIILNMSTMLKDSEFSKFCMYHPFSAFITLAASVLQNPKAVNTEEKVNVLIRSARDFFSNFRKKSAVDKGWVADEITRRMLYIVVNVVEESNPSLKFDYGNVFEGMTTSSEPTGEEMKIQKNGSIGDHRPRKKSKKAFSSNRNFYNVPVASLIAPPALSYKVPDGTAGQHLQQQPLENGTDNLKGNQNVELHNSSTPFEGGRFSFDGLTETQEDPSLNGFASNEAGNLDSLLKLFSKNETTPTNDSDVQTSDTMPSDGESLFQNIFNIPSLQVDLAGTNHFMASPSDML